MIWSRSVMWQGRKRKQFRTWSPPRSVGLQDGDRPTLVIAFGKQAFWVTATISSGGELLVPVNIADAISVYAGRNIDGVVLFTLIGIESNAGTDPQIIETERDALVALRRGQDAFRRSLGSGPIKPLAQVAIG